ncbi:MAG: hypothetical protein QOI00_1616 [Chloroflexota bacterium]|jgi:hypothetical protein|nr:hypothetical protein [Chloroflexota bacterium]
MLSQRVAVLVATVSIVATGCASSGSGQPTGSGSTVAAAAASTTAASPAAAASLIPDPSQTARPSARALRVARVELRADPAESVGACPLEITFSATISAIGDGDLSYRWRSSDGDVSPVKVVSFKRSTSMTVSSTWTVDPKSVPTHAGWSSIELIDPAPGSSDVMPTAEPAAFAFTCPTDNDVEAIGFGIGGSDADCSIKKHLKTFDPNDRIRAVANYWPSLRAGTTVTFSLSRDGVLVQGYPIDAKFDTSTRCVFGNVSTGDMPAGTYRLVVEPDTARAVSGTFDVR